jgi:hypothetical protein
MFAAIAISYGITVVALVLLAITQVSEFALSCGKFSAIRECGSGI